ncbi:MAG: hypothetical protein Q9164_001612 [Protoblastenia rupestris]
MELHETTPQDIARYAALGTLGYLPLELRQQIYGYMCDSELLPVYPAATNERFLRYMDCRFCHHDELGTGAFKLFSYTPVPIDLCDEDTRALCGSSSAIAREYRLMFLSTHEFSFSCPLLLKDFLQQIEGYERGLRRVSLFIYGCERCTHNGAQSLGEYFRTWKEVVTQLPPWLQSVSFEIGERPESPNPENSPSPKDKRKLECQNLDVLNKAVKRACPQASTSLTFDPSWEMNGLYTRIRPRVLSPTARRAFEGILQDLEQPSEEFTTWMQGQYS